MERRKEEETEVGCTEMSKRREREKRTTLNEKTQGRKIGRGGKSGGDRERGSVEKRCGDREAEKKKKEEGEQSKKKRGIKGQ